jgi:hypothetical protein
VVLRFAPIFCAISVYAQITTVPLSGFVVDPSNRAVAGALVRVSDRSRGWVAETRSGESGLFRFAGLAPAEYLVTASADRFGDATMRVQVEIGNAISLTISLPLQGVRQSVDVGAAHDDSADLGTVLTESRIRGLPLNRRDFLQLALLSPGVLPAVQNSELSSRGGFAMHASGGREEFNQFLLDGVDNNDPYNNRYLSQPTVEAIQEFKIETNSYRAEYGRSAGAQINVVTRRGSNEWHGEAYEFLRNRVLDARNFFDGAQTPQYVRNQYGVALGGPVKTGRTFFFANFSALAERRGLSKLSAVPTFAERAGNIGATVLDPFTRAPFPGNRIPASRISPVAPRILDLFPLPTFAGAGGNYRGQPVLRESSPQGSGRVDRRISSRDNLTLRYTYGAQDLFEPFVQETTTVPGFGNFVRNTAHSALAEYLRTISPRVVNSLRLGFTRSYRQALQENYRTDAGALWNVPWLNLRPRDLGFPALNIAGYSTVGDATQLPIERYTNTYQLSDALSWSHGSHLWKFGADLRRQQANAILDYFARGSLSFSGALSGSGIGDLLLGLPSFALQAQFDNPQTMRTTQYGYYAQDDWKLLRRLTLSVGLRYEFDSPVTDPHDRMSTFDPATNRIVRVGTEGVSRSATRPDRNNFAPRVGIAWAANEWLTLRAGYGIYYDAGMFVINSSQYFNPPFFNVRVFFPTASSLLSLSNPFPTSGGVTPAPSPNAVSPDARTAYLQHWSFSAQYSVDARTSVQLAYAGSKGTDLIRSRDLNQPRPAPGDIQSRRPVPSMGSIFFIETSGNSTYNSLQASLDRRIGGKLSVLAAYTFGKSIDDTSAFLGTKTDKNFPQDSMNYAAERARSSFDMRQRFTVAPVYKIPMLHNTELRGIVTAQSGQPMTPVIRFDNSNTGNAGGNFGLDRPNLLHSPQLDSASANLWFDTNAFAIAPRYRFGNAGRNVVTGPGLVNVDVSLVRTFRIREKLSISVHAEAFNLLNRTQLDEPERYADESSTFGKIFSAKAPRQLQFALRMQF